MCGIQAPAKLDGWVAFVLYLALAICLDREAITHLSTGCACGLPGDPAQYTWAFVWFPHALFHGLNLLNSKAMWAPEGINLAGATAVPLLAFAAAPITWLWGPVVAYNVVSIAAPISAAWCAYRLCRYVTGARWASILAGTSFGFGAYEIAELNGHLHLSVCFCIPLAILCILKFLRGDLATRGFVIRMTLVLLAQMFISTELLFTLSVLVWTGLALAWVVGGEDLRRVVRARAPWIALTYLITAAISSYYIYELLQAPAYAKGTGALFPTDLTALVVPMQWVWIGGSSFALYTNRFVNTGETLAYVGIPMVLVTLWVIGSRIRLGWDRVLAGLLVATVLWILGPQLFVHLNASVWLPYHLLYKAPGFNEVLQGRVAVYLDLICAVCLAIWLAGSRRRAWLRWAVGILAVLFVLPNFFNPGPGYYSTWTNPTFFKTAMYKRYIRPGQTILPIDWNSLSESPMWQAEDGMYYNLASGYFTTAPPTGWQGHAVFDLWNDTPRGHRDRRGLRSLIMTHRISDVVVQGDEISRWARTLRDAGLRPTATVGGVQVYKVPANWW